MREIQICVPSNKGIRAAIIRMLEQKSGVSHMPSQDCGRCEWLKNDNNGLWVGGQTNNREVITIAQLEAMPDYTEPTKEMTLPEIIKELGYEVKIVK